MIWKTRTLHELEMGLKCKDGRVVGLVGPGRHRWLDPLNRTSLHIVDIRQGIAPVDWVEMLETQHDDLIAGKMIIVRPGRHELALVTRNGTPLTVVQHGAVRGLWTVRDTIEVETIDLRTAHRIDPLEADRWARLAGLAITQAQIASHEAGILHLDGLQSGRLGPGRHAFWAATRAVRVVKHDLRPQTLDVVAQEILTKDRVTVRINLSAITRVTDPEVLTRAVPDVGQHMHRLVQLAARAAVGGRTLDAVLKERAKVDDELTTQIHDRLGDIGLAVSDVRIKDVILPGDMREMLNKVVEAEKAAEANVIRRREETAATRSLLNTARLMENHPTLMRLKELEALERLTDKVGRIDVHQTAPGAGLPALLDTLMGDVTKKVDQT